MFWGYVPVAERPKAKHWVWWPIAILVMAVLIEGGLWLASGLPVTSCFEVGSCIVGLERSGRWGVSAEPVFMTWHDGLETTTDEIGRRIKLGIVDIDILLAPTAPTRAHTAVRGR
jgi:hypothetical protein